MITISVVTQLSHRRHATERLDERCAIGGMSFRLNIIKLSSIVHVFTPHRDVFPKQQMPAVNDRIAQREIITAQTTRLARLDTRYTIVIQCYARRTQMNDSIGARRDAMSALVSLFLPIPPLSLSLAMRKCASYAHRLDDADNCIPSRSHSWWKSTMVRRPRGQWGSSWVWELHSGRD